MCAEVDVVQVRVKNCGRCSASEDAQDSHHPVSIGPVGLCPDRDQRKIDAHIVFILSAKTTMNRSRKEGLKTTASIVKHYSEVAQNHLDQVLSILRTSTLVWRNKSQIFSNFVRCLKPNSRQVGVLRDLGGRSADRGQTIARKFPSQA